MQTKTTIIYQQQTTHTDGVIAMFILKVISEANKRTINGKNGPMDIEEQVVEQIGGRFPRQGTIRPPRDFKLKPGDIVTASANTFNLTPYDAFAPKNYLDVELLSTAIEELKKLGILK